MASFWSGTVDTFLRSKPEVITASLALAQVRHFRLNETQQVRAWEATIAILRTTFAAIPEAATWRVLLEFPMLRLGHRPDVILLANAAIFVLEMKAGAELHTVTDRRQVEDYAIDLHDFHAGSRAHPIIPILIAEHAPIGTAQSPLILGHGVTPTLDANAHSLAGLLRELGIRTAQVARRLDADAWLAAPYAPVPTIVDAACMLYAKHGVADIRAARSDAPNLGKTTAAILQEIAQARNDQSKLILFVTGIPGAGKTLCGLNTIFGVEGSVRGTYLTGNPTLVHVLPEALTRDAVQFGAKRGDAARRMQSAIQSLPRFRDEYVDKPDHVPPESMVVVDEAQRSWSEAWARAKTRDKAVRLTMSEPAHILDAMARHPGFSAIVCLVGSGQEIHSGEGGLAEWGEALRRAALDGCNWRVRAAPDIIHASDARHLLGSLPDLVEIEALHLDVPMRQIRNAAAASWVDAVLRGDATAASDIAIAAGELPFLLTRDAATMRDWLRVHTRGLRRSGLLASSGAARVRAEGIGPELPHMDAAAVAHWFLDRFPNDVRASDALEVVATEFSCQGLELDYVGLCWDADLSRESGQIAWRSRDFRGTRWQVTRQPEAIANHINTYRVLLTRARYETVIFVPRGAEEDQTRSPSRYDGIAAFLLACGARRITHLSPSVAQNAEPLLL